MTWCLELILVCRTNTKDDAMPSPYSIDIANSLPVNLPILCLVVFFFLPVCLCFWFVAVLFCLFDVGWHFDGAC